MSTTELSVQICTTPQEKETAQRFRQRHFFDRLASKDPYAWTFNQEGHAHLMLYKKGRMIGYAHLQYWPGYRAALRMIVIDEKERKRGYGSSLLKSCEQKLKEERIKILQTEAAPDAIEFYRSLGYTEMPFDDPEKHPSDERDIPLGKKL
ncbi:GNAT family N-acetyltransferase [Candidatus Protochlamydia phocaeensis]|uniref:GNAT family N-acetyltransferase n=1 Tax=Candidatus Protochlamydia phocaeensis TaxID=1414722 RepID=UPI000839A957|nr:GNAT family N-acetyltransferase [Candidatus Protochlamydia phocaeensis]